MKRVLILVLILSMVNINYNHMHAIIHVVHVMAHLPINALCVLVHKYLMDYVIVNKWII
jgi:hypothetical protein